MPTSRGALLALALLAAPGALRAQSGHGRQFVGVAAGVTLSDTYGGVATDQLVGGSFGMVLGYRAANWTALTLEPAWTQKGHSTAAGDLKFDYLEFPATTAFVKRLGEDWRFSGYTGITLALKLKCSATDPLFDCADASGSEWSIPLGFRFGRRVGENNVAGLDVRYNIPISDAFRSQPVRNRNFEFRLFYLFGDLAR